ncbi:hypothetical protein ILUMI_10809 [Ignelater luminosus]|uniref:nucleoside diphosphate phosphatase n=1 Tax=Ignelater luminosus TaxID=2038154 RepID=A0A8K0CX73_IGNLU|nr:hypothetical protein ILUMI_10809 [Ignelater luminosus]
MNSELRRRKLKESNGRPIPKRKRKEAESNSIHRSLLCLILSGTILTVFIILYIDYIPWHLGHRTVDSIAKSFGYDKLVHAVVIDAGSTGSRVLAFTFHEAYLDGHLILDKELFEYTKPGLSSFADSPEKGVASINSLLEKAKKEIPEKYWSSTPLILRATAGLRLLPQEKAENLLNSVRDFFKKTPFLTNDNSVAIMDGTDEGIFSWFTVNFLLERIGGNPEKTVAALDLGGGSTQVTFSPSTPETLSQKEHIHQAIAPQGSIPVFTRSYLGLGLMAARKEIITLNQGTNTNVTSECVNPIIKNKKFTYGGVTYYVSGLKENYPTMKIPGGSYKTAELVPIVSFSACSEMITEYIKKIAKPIGELPHKQINAFSYYFDRASEVGLIDEMKGGLVKVSQFKETARTVCKQANVEQPFMCLDLTFIWSLLENGFGLRPDTKVFLFKKINGHEISWALGAAYGLLKGS